jgi:hypothetical protein
MADGQRWRITFMDGTEELTPEDAGRLELDRNGAVWSATGVVRGRGGTETKAMYPTVNIRKVVRVR